MRALESDIEIEAGQTQFVPLDQLSERQISALTDVLDIKYNVRAVKETLPTLEEVKVMSVTNRMIELELEIENSYFVSSDAINPCFITVNIRRNAFKDTLTD